MKILIFGGTGLLGHDLVRALGAGNQIRPLASTDCDIAELDAVRARVKAEKPDVVINSAAITDVDKCEEAPDLAYRINAVGPKNIAIACRDTNTKIVHVSTDYVFDGAKGEPYTEFDRAAPVSVYGRSKLAGEQFVQTIAGNFMIIRTAWVFGEKRQSFVDYVVNGIKNNTEVTVVKDMVSSPTYAADLAGCMKRLIALDQNGIFHVANKGFCSRVQMAEEIMKILKKPGKLHSVTQRQWKRPAARPVFSALRNYHMSLINEDHMPDWCDALERYIKLKFE